MKIDGSPTKKELMLQDLMDGAAYDLLATLAGHPLTWDIVVIGELRDFACELLKKRYGIDLIYP